MFEGETFDGSDHLQVSKSSGDSLSSVPTYSVATRPEWAFDGVDGSEQPQSYMIQCRNLKLIEIVTRLQLLVGRLGMQWFHPDDYTIIARHEASGLYIAMQAIVAEDVFRVSFVVQFFRGDIEDFHGFCRSAEEAMAENLDNPV
jgi:hypothetical protein